MTSDFVWDHYDTFFVPDHQSPLGETERPSIAVHDHFLIQWQLNWRLDGLLCKTMSCFWTELFALISLDALEVSTNGWYVNNQSGYSSSILHLLPCQSEHRGEGDSGGGGGISGDKSLSSLPPCGTPVESRLAWRRALSRTHKVPASDTLTPEAGTRSPASAEQTLYSAKWRKHNYIGPTAYN